MTPEERDRMEELCRCIQSEEDRQVFSELVRELNELLSRSDQQPKRIEAQRGRSDDA
jgi:hypothetical protein